jgi:AraC-type DNA-binding domain-containing proteins
MSETELLELIAIQDRRNEEKVRKDLVQVLEEEFVMTRVMRGYLDYLSKCNQLDRFDVDEFISKNDIPVKKISVFDISRHNPDSAMYLHKHNYLELDYVYRGSCSYYINNDNAVYQLKEKELCIVNQNVIHGIQVQNKEDILVKCMIPFDQIHPDCFVDFDLQNVIKNFLLHALNENFTNVSYLLIEPEEQKWMDQIMYCLFYEYVNRRQGWKQMIDHYISDLFLHLMREKHDKIRLITDTVPDSLNISKIIHSIQMNYQSITLKDIAVDLHFHENYLSRMIKQQAKFSFRELLCQVRLQEAEKLLLDTDLPVTDIASKIGYVKSNYFYKLFKAHYGMTPVEFRESRHRQASD